jgi:hypothetical protein
MECLFGTARSVPKARSFLLYGIPIMTVNSMKRMLELVYTAWDLKPFAEDMGYHGEPFKWDEDRRALAGGTRRVLCAAVRAESG